jgi:hypothetical protein
MPQSLPRYSKNDRTETVNEACQLLSIRRAPEARTLPVWIYRKVFVFEMFGDALGLFHLDFVGRVV